MVIKPTKTVTLPIANKQEFHQTIDEIAREGARKMLLGALEAEVEDYINAHCHLVDENDHRLVVRNGNGKERSITMGCGTVKIQAPRINDQRDGNQFISRILPPYLRKSPKIETLLPLLYLKGISTGKFQDVLGDFLGDTTAGLSAATITKLITKWQQEYSEWQKKPITEDYIYIWADGINISIRLGEDNKLCLLVIIGATLEGRKKVLAVHAGYRESEESWAYVLNSLIDRGLKDPLIAIGDGALGFWKAIRASSGFKNTKEQRCWVHKIANVLDKLPKRSQADAKTLLHDMMMAEKLEHAIATKNKFVQLYSDKYPKTVECLIKDWDKLITFFSCPAKHWKHIRSTNPIESSFATVRLRSNVTKGAGNKSTAVTMTFKLLLESEKKWKKIEGYEDLKKMRQGVAFQDGIMISNDIQVAAS